MPPLSSATDSRPPVEVTYRLIRAVLRMWFALFFRKIRLLEEGFPASGAAILVVDHPAGLLDALILVAAFERQLHCVLDERLVWGPIRGFFARGLSMVVRSEEEQSRQLADASCAQLLTLGSAVVIFAEPAAARGADSSPFASSVAALALETESRQFGQVTIFPVHLFLPVSPSRSTELLIYADAPLATREYTARAKDQNCDPAILLSAALDQACRHNAFRLQPENFEQFLADAEDMLRRDLEDDWRRRSNWKQKVEGFELSRFVKTAADQMNTLHPGLLVALWESLDAYREAQRMASLRQLETANSNWLKSPLLKVGTWFELALGAPIAVYGLLNHIVILPILQAAGLIGRKAERSAALEWIARVLVALACYTGQVALCAHYLGRAAAGYYAVSLPLSGAYAWRYFWLLRNRGRLAYFAATIPNRTAKLTRMRKQLLADLNAARNKFGVASGTRVP